MVHKHPGVFHGREGAHNAPINTATKKEHKIDYPKPHLKLEMWNHGIDGRQQKCEGFLKTED